MKHYFTLLFSLLITFPLFAQNEWFIPFGQTQSQVRQYLADKDYLLSVKEDAGMHRLLASIENDKHIEYVFEKGALYATSVRRKYANKKVSKEILRSCLEYMDLVSSGKIQQKNDGNATCHTVVTHARVIKLFVIDHPDKSQTLRLTSFSRRYGPMKNKDLHYEMNLFEAPATAAND